MTTHDDTTELADRNSLELFRDLGRLGQPLSTEQVELVWLKMRACALEASAAGMQEASDLFAPKGGAE